MTDALCRDEPGPFTRGAGERREIPAWSAVVQWPTLKRRSRTAAGSQEAGGCRMLRLSRIASDLWRTEVVAAGTRRCVDMDLIRFQVKGTDQFAGRYRRAMSVQIETTRLTSKSVPSSLCSSIATTASHVCESTFFASQVSLTATRDPSSLATES
jgi:hypothetical protein